MDIEGDRKVGRLADCRFVTNIRVKKVQTPLLILCQASQIGVHVCPTRHTILHDVSGQVRKQTVLVGLLQSFSRTSKSSPYGSRCSLEAYVNIVSKVMNMTSLWCHKMNWTHNQYLTAVGLLWSLSKTNTSSPYGSWYNVRWFLIKIFLWCQTSLSKKYLTSYHLIAII